MKVRVIEEQKCNFIINMERWVGVHCFVWITKQRMDVRTWEIKKERQNHRIIVPNRQLPRFCFNGSSSMQNLSNLIFIIFLLFLCSLETYRGQHICLITLIWIIFFLIMSFQSDVCLTYVWDIYIICWQTSYTFTTLTFYVIWYINL